MYPYVYELKNWLDFEQKTKIYMIYNAPAIMLSVARFRSICQEALFNMGEVVFEIVKRSVSYDTLR